MKVIDLQQWLVQALAKQNLMIHCHNNAIRALSALYRELKARRAA